MTRRRPNSNAPGRKTAGNFQKVRSICGFQMTTTRRAQFPATESGDPALFDKLPIVWHPKERPDLNSIYHELIKLRRQSPAFHNDRVIWLKNTDEKSTVTFMRADEREQYVVVINFSNHPDNAGVEVSNPADFQLVTIKGMAGCSPSDFPSMHLGGFEWRIYHRAIPTINAASTKSVSVR